MPRESPSFSAWVAHKDTLFLAKAAPKDPFFKRCHNKRPKHFQMTLFAEQVDFMKFPGFFVDCTSSNPRSFSKRPLREPRFSLTSNTTQLPKPLSHPTPHPPILTLRCTYIPLSYINTRNDRRSNLSSI